MWYTFLCDEYVAFSPSMRQLNISVLHHGSITQVKLDFCNCELKIINPSCQCVK